ncbi:MAG: polyprenyl synthetase family protein [Patescibacteria group bacterium]|nr:polyprenyl synthetase family protein [Patescibacteria group bacterium]
MNKPEAVLTIFDKYVRAIDQELDTFFTAQGEKELYLMMRYFLGYLDRDFNKVHEYSGKRFRSGACLLLSDYYGKMKEALPVAASIEIFHNFTLIHDDIEDHDPLRRGKETVWKLWGVEQAINTGDAQLALSYIELLKYAEKNPRNATKVQRLLYENYLKVAEGQYMDIKMAESDIDDVYVTVDNYLEMIYLKSATLVAVSAMAAGLVADKDEAECQKLWDYGLNLGLAYQLSDDLISIWGKAENTGKVEAKDLEERKKTLPVIYLYDKADDKKKNKFAALYDKKENLTHDEISEIKMMLSEDKAHDYVWDLMKEKIELSNKAIEALSFSDSEKQTLLNINKALIPNMKWWDA